MVVSELRPPIVVVTSMLCMQQLCCLLKLPSRFSTLQHPVCT